MPLPLRPARSRTDDDDDDDDDTSPPAAKRKKSEPEDPPRYLSFDGFGVSPQDRLIDIHSEWKGMGELSHVSSIQLHPGIHSDLPQGCHLLLSCFGSNQA